MYLPLKRKQKLLLRSLDTPYPEDCQHFHKGIFLLKADALYCSLNVLLLKMQCRVKPQKWGSQIAVETMEKNEVKQEKQKHWLLIIRANVWKRFALGNVYFRNHGCLHRRTDVSPNTFYLTIITLFHLAYAICIVRLRLWKDIFLFCIVYDYMNNRSNTLVSSMIYLLLHCWFITVLCSSAGSYFSNFVTLWISLLLYYLLLFIFLQSLSQTLEFETFSQKQFPLKKSFSVEMCPSSFTVNTYPKIQTIWHHILLVD